MKKILLLILFSLCLTVDANSSFVAQGKISELLVTPDGSIVVRIMSGGGCNKESYYLSSSAKSKDILIDLVLIALEKQMTVGLHNSSGANCENKKVYFDLLTVKNY
jgi:hypothetical protein